MGLSSRMNAAAEHVGELQGTFQDSPMKHSRKWLGRVYLPKELQFQGSRKDCRFHYFSLSVPLLGRENDLHRSPWAGQLILHVDQERRLAFFPGKCICSLNSWLSCSKKAPPGLA